MKKMFACAFAACSLWLTGCQSHPVAAWRPRSFKNDSRQPASSLPAGYQIKNQDHWLIGVWESDEKSPFLAVCKIRRTAIGYEAGSSKDISGAAIMKVVQDAQDQKLIDRLVDNTGQGFEEGYGPYWADCEKEGAPKCAGRLSLLSFLSYQGVGQMDAVSTDIFDERNIAVEKGGKTWFASSQGADMLKAAKCLCAHYARPEEKEFFPASACE